MAGKRFTNTNGTILFSVTNSSISTNQTAPVGRYPPLYRAVFLFTQEELTFRWYCALVMVEDTHGNTALFNSSCITVQASMAQLFSYKEMLPSQKIYYR